MKQVQLGDVLDCQEQTGLQEVLGGVLVAGPCFGKVDRLLNVLKQNRTSLAHSVSATKE